MKFYQLPYLEEGMILARDLHTLNASNEILLLRKKMALTQKNIAQLGNMGISGAFICDGIDDDLDMDHLLCSEEKKQAISEIKNLFDKYDLGEDCITKDDIQSLREIANSIVDAILSHQEVEIGVIELKSYDEYTYHHCLSVCVISVAIASALNFTREQLVDLGLAGLLHDIGKTMVDVKLINKPGKLTNAEFNQVAEHALLGGKYLLEHDLINEDIYYGVISHHEKYDGKGYPFGIQGEEIHIYGRVIAVADVYDALTSNRPYRKAKSPTEAFECILGGVGTHFDMNVVSAFTKKIAPYPVGSCVKLSNNDVAIVLQINQELPLRPRARSVFSGRIYDLSKDVDCTSITIIGNADDITNRK